MNSKKVFIIEDEEKIREELTKFLEKYGYIVRSSNDFENIVDISLEYEPSIILLDINLPYYDGYYICREIRKRSEVPIIVVTSRQGEMDELMSMNLGADDFVTKPYNTQILLARMASILKRTYSDSEGEGECFEHRGLKYNMSTSEVSFNREVMELTKNESKILYVLIKNKGKIVSRDEIIKALWQTNEFIDDNTLTVNVNRLRRKIEGIGAEGYLQTKRGQGYILA
ncbi:response regulator transcription factor [Clostridium sp. LIBA-8841]|uniref:response regulator transcription factor n=1 Tax=Clostridium sp. LIBA-8841 TaxID=2987530 RepID=UPI002AC68AF7|nr:response regulator transcription factor [Clostridium sp. LIBA-8841]MDZ5255143.1 response regulator transcription factor [Clostridium sp. LIBA-8841]